MSATTRLVLTVFQNPPGESAGGLLLFGSDTYHECRMRSLIEPASLPLIQSKKPTSAAERTNRAGSRAYASNQREASPGKTVPTILMVSERNRSRVRSASKP